MHGQPNIKISFVMSVRLSAWKNSAHIGWILMKFDVWEFFFKSVQKIQFLLKSNKKIRYFTWRPIYIFYRI